ncbi:hypothetical protein GCM10010517_49790 [Streptosporangium fragile]|uniref:HTH-like domain-containing protein n=1 Tax=Streptosporangium fragile TaxID=46186 RepID=A0ABN3W1T7_9ACTN
MSVAAFIRCQKTEYGISHVISCQALGVSQSWFYKWKDRAPTSRERRRADLDAAIEECFTASGGTYGSPRITRDLREEGWRVSVNTVAARMAELGLAGRARKRSRSLTRQGKRPAAPDLVRRRFTAVAPAPGCAWRQHRERGCSAALERVDPPRIVVRLAVLAQLDLVGPPDVGLTQRHRGAVAQASGGARSR